METARRLAAAAGGVTLGHAVDGYLATLSGAEQASTRRAYGQIGYDGFIWPHHDGSMWLHLAES